ncbi:6-phosphogluconolactonase, partial [Candidatus Gottesmanbacteria bacterium]|nr:6-phosphogluconolactonase [Candidatus Gottesmanbacteria bacterium]
MQNNTVIHVEKNNLIFRKSSDFLIKWIKLYHNIGQKTLLLLSGGSVVRLNSDVTQFIKNSDLNFDFLTFAQVDERFQPENQEDINAYQIEKTGLWKVCKEKNIPYYLIS